MVKMEINRPQAKKQLPAALHRVCFELASVFEWKKGETCEMPTATINTKNSDKSPDYYFTSTKLKFH